MSELLDPRHLIDIWGLVGIGIIVFVETGLLVGFFLPGDSLLFTAGILAAAGHLSLGWMMLVAFVAAVVGDSVGYAIGRRAGNRIYNRPEGRLGIRHRIEQARVFYERRGGSTIILARFIPIIRTFAPVVAGAAGMEYRRFLTFNVLGGLLWVAGLSLAGYWLGQTIPSVDRYLLPIIAVIVLISVTPMIVEAARGRARRSRATPPARDARSPSGAAAEPGGSRGRRG